ncbi:MAG: haloacid dehalogenase type II [Betaproteobacteria bacterium]|nr:haloacid dehalogenase type II [Betaproteobacteria bacterium]
MPLTALAYDAYGTLFDVHSVVSAAERLFPGHGKPLSQLWRTKQLEYTWLRSLMRRHADFNLVTQDALRHACAALKLPYTEAALEQLMHAYRQLDVFADAHAAVNALKGNFKLAILSNGAPDMLNAVVANSPLHDAFDAVLSVEDVGVFKPDPRVYQLAVDRLGVDKASIGFVSSNGWDAAGAKAFGFTVFWVNRARAPKEELGAMPDFELHSLDELPARIARV